MLAAALAGALTACTGAPPPVVRSEPAPAPTVATFVASAPNLSRFAAVAAGSEVARTLAGPGPLTVFAPSDAAFGRLPPAALAALFRPENRASLTRLLQFHVVAGRLTQSDLRARVAAAGGTATLSSIAGDPLTLTVTQGHLTLSDADGNRSYLETPDIARANGVVHVVNGVLVPRLS